MRTQSRKNGSIVNLLTNEQTNFKLLIPARWHAAGADTKDRMPALMEPSRGCRQYRSCGINNVTLH